MQLPAPTHPTEVDLRAYLIDLIQTADNASIKRWHSKITKKRGVHRTCTVQSAPKSNWKPQSTAEALRIIELLEKRVGLRSAPFPVDENCPCAKFMLSEVCQVLLLRDSADAALVDKSTKLKAAAAATSVACRICEEAHSMQREDGGGAGLIEMHGNRQSPVWAPSTARGSGIVLSKDAWSLFETALARVRARLASM